MWMLCKKSKVGSNQPKWLFQPSPDEKSEICVTSLNAGTRRTKISIKGTRNRHNEKLRIKNCQKKKQVDLLRETLRKKLETTFKDIWDTPHAFQYLARSIFLPFPHSIVSLHSRFEKLKNVLHIEDMESKHKRMINCFKVEMERLV